jgi:ABC-2 type transport system permease protein
MVADTPDDAGRSSVRTPSSADAAKASTVATPGASSPAASTPAATAEDVAGPGRVFAWTVRQNRRALMLWSVAIAAVSAMYASFYPMMEGPEMETLIEGMPEGLVAALGYDRIGTAAGYLESTVYALLGVILMMVFAITYGARVLAGVEEDGSLELEITSGVSRRRVLMERYASLAVHLVSMALAVTVAIALVALGIEMDIGLGGLLAGGLGMFLFALVVGSVTFTVGAATGRRGLALGLGAGFGVLAYLADAFAGMLDDGRWLEALSPFSWYLSGDPLTEGIDVLGFGGLVLLTVAALGVATVTFEQRDLGV